MDGTSSLDFYKKTFDCVVDNEENGLVQYSSGFVPALSRHSSGASMDELDGIVPTAAGTGKINHSVVPTLVPILVQRNPALHDGPRRSLSQWTA